MKKRIGAFVVATVMTASLAALPANAMSYTVEGAKERNFGPITVSYTHLTLPTKLEV